MDTIMAGSWLGRLVGRMRYYLPTEALHRLTGERACVLPARRRRIACAGAATRSLEHGAAGSQSRARRDEGRDPIPRPA